MLPRLVSTARRNLGDDRRAIVLVATSGDTGKAALEGFRDVDGTGMAVFYPVDGVSQIQRLQMATQEGSNCLLYTSITAADASIWGWRKSMASSRCV